MNISEAFDKMLENKAEAKNSLNELVLPMMSGQPMSKEELKVHWDNINKKIDNITKPFTE